MNAPTNSQPTHESADKITSMLRQLDAAAPPPPVFGDLRATAEPDRSQRPSRMIIGAAASIVALGVGGLLVLGNRDAAPVAEQPDQTAAGQSIPDAEGSVPGEEPSIGTEPPVVDSTFVGVPLVGSVLLSDATPMFEVDRPDWVKVSVYGSDELPLGDITLNMTAFVGDDGPMYDQPLIAVSVFDSTGLDISTFGEPIDVGGVASVYSAQANDARSGRPGSFVNLTVPLADQQAMRVNTTGLDVDATVALAEQVTIVGEIAQLDTPAGFRELAFVAPESWRHLSYRWVFDDGTPVPEPVEITTPEGSGDLIDLQPSIEVNGSNLGPVDLMGSISNSAMLNRVVNGIDVALEPVSDEPGYYRANWLDGDWSYYAIGQNLDSEEQFLDLIASMKTVDAETFAAAGGLDVLPPGRYDDLASQVLAGVGLSPDQLERAVTVVMPTDLYNYRFELNLGAGCSLRSAWVTGDEAGKAAALAAVEVAASAARESGSESVGLSELADSMRAGRSDEVAQFGSNDCPLWSITY